jgi:hypothetical protein
MPFTVALSQSQIIQNNTSNVFSFFAPGFNPVLLDFEVLGGFSPAGQTTIFLQFFVNGNLVTTQEFQRWLSFADFTSRRRMIVIPASALLPVFFPVNNLLTIKSVMPTDYFFIGPLIFQT